MTDSRGSEEQGSPRDTWGPSLVPVQHDRGPGRGQSEPLRLFGLRRNSSLRPSGVSTVWKDTTPPPDRPQRVPIFDSYGGRG